MERFRFPLSASLLLLCVSISLSAEGLKLNSNDIFPRSAPDGSGYEDRIIAEAFRRLGLRYELMKVPSERALASVDRGEIDGDYVRIAGLEQSYPGLVRVGEPIAAMEFGSFVRDRERAPKTWEELRNRRVGMIIGWKIVEQRTSGFPAMNAVRDEASLFALLESGRVDAIVYDLLEGARYLKRTGLDGTVFPGPVLERRDMFLYLNAKHADLAVKLAAALRDMRKEGLIDRITRETIDQAGN